MHLTISVLIVRSSACISPAPACGKCPGSAAYASARSQSTNDGQYSGQSANRPVADAAVSDIVVAAGHYRLSSELAVDRSVKIEAAIVGSVILDANVDTSTGSIPAEC